MAATTLGVKLDDATRERLRRAASSIDRTPHWLIKQAIFSYLERLETQGAPPELPPAGEAADDAAAPTEPPAGPPQPFLDFAQSVLPQSVLRSAITAATRRPEPELLPLLLEQAKLPPPIAQATQQLALRLAEQLRNSKGPGGRAGIVQGLLQEFSLSSQEGVALMCLAEALLRIPDKATRDALIRDKISRGDWQPHLGQSPSLFVNAATWGLMFTGKLVATHNEARLSGALARILGKGGEPLVRKGVDMAMRLMGEQFVTGETIAAALANARPLEAKGFRYSYDMLGEAALTDADAQRYLASYQQAIHAIGKASHGRGIYEGPGISIKLSALHPRYSRAQHERVMAELYPRLLALSQLARRYDIGLNIDAEEADRLEISLDLLERLCFEPGLAGWNGIGFVIQAYQKRCPQVIDCLVDLGRRSRRRLMIRLVKGAYWDSEIKRAQLDGLEGYPVFTRKAYTDVSYLACARKLLAVPEVIYPQFATHNAQTLAAIYHLAGNNYYAGQYEFQCLHGMGEPLYEQVVGPVNEGKLARPCRIYAPVGVHETLLAYLVRRLLENGANTSFVNRIADPALPLEDLVQDPIGQVEALAAEEGRVGEPHPRIALPRDLYGSMRSNSAGIDLSNEHRLGSLSGALLRSGQTEWHAEPGGAGSGGEWRPVPNPADRRDRVGLVREAGERDVAAALQAASAAALVWQGTPPAERAAVLDRAAELLESEGQLLIGLLVREAGKSFANAVSEVREATDFLRYYAHQVRSCFDNGTYRPLGPVVCISPWNFPLAIFTGQVAAALAAGNAVLAKPAEQTPLIAAQAVRILHAAGVPGDVLQLLPGPGETVGAQLVGDHRVAGVLFTGSTEVARILQRTLAGRLGANGRAIPLVAETGGQNAMIVDSSALAEQVVADVMTSAFDSAGQRCSALRVLCVQHEAAPRIVEMLRGAMAEACLGNPERLDVDIGPVIDAEARANIERHLQTMRDNGRSVWQCARSDGGELAHGEFVPPTLVEIDSLEELKREVFGPVLHLLRYQRPDLGRLVAQINATGYGLTMGLHTRIDETIAQVVDAAHAGNLYVNRNMVGAVVGVQPFGGHGLSGTGPKAGGPLYLLRLLAQRPAPAVDDALSAMGAQQAGVDQSLRERIRQDLAELGAWAEAQPHAGLSARCRDLEARSPSGKTWTLRGPTGEVDTYSLMPRDVVLCLAADEGDLLTQLAAVLAVGSQALWPAGEAGDALYGRLPQTLRRRIGRVGDWRDAQASFAAVLHHGDGDHLREVCREVAGRDGAIVGVVGLQHGETAVPLERLLVERALSVNTAAAGGNASLMTIG
ncbi:MAG TPA: trifunctional transcriptional regulator/proline dehydrogenase/L-glutamate gamma-semialdehyde dehydrogenase [Rubrivivax sp.]|nr:trifunctional transcriptional regulator/proline dehydrogenase/L-glutamate gamma-semialdehyde dehydrogenase [Rubrivivax sp.]